MTQPLQPDAVPVVRRNRRAWIVAVGVLIAALSLATAVLVSHRNAPNRLVQPALADEAGAKVAVYRRNFFGGDELVFDIRSASGEASMIEMTRHLLKAAEALKNQNFSRVYLAYKGKEKFFLEGPYFKRLGEEREWQNPVYTVRTMPENVRRLDGSPAYGSWSGGLLGVLGRQLDDNEKFHHEWWMDDAIAEVSR